MQKKKKICFVVAAPISARAFLKGHMDNLRKHFEVHLVANFQSKAEKEDFPGIRCHAVPIARKIDLRHDLKALWNLFRLFRKERFMAVHSLTPKAGLTTALAGFLAGIKNRIHIYTGQVWATKSGFARILLKSIDKLIALLNTHLLVDGGSQQSFLIEQGVLTESNSAVMADGSICGVDIGRFTLSDAQRIATREELNITPQRVVFIFLGRLNRDKGLHELLEAFNRLAAENEAPFLLLVGLDEEKITADLSAYPHIRPAVNYHYYGLTSTPEKLLSSGDVFVLPTYREGFGSSVIEASCMGLPVICSDVYGVMDAMVEDVTGLRCKVRNVDSLYECMSKLYADPELCRQLGRQGRERVMKKFSARVVEEAWEKFYLEL